MPKLFLAVGLLALLFLVFLYTRYRIHIYSWKLKFPKPKNRVVIDRNVKVPMLDGVLLAADVYRPAQRGKFPVILMRTPYDKGGSYYSYKLVAELFASQGYVVVIQDIRGKYASEGNFLPYFHEALDGHSTISWAGTASWSNGNVAVVGSSYSGSCAWLASRYANPHLRTIITLFTTSDTYAFWMDRGMPFLKGPLTWLSEFSKKEKNREFSYSKIEPVLWKLPVSELDVHATGHPIPFYREYLSHQIPDAFWENISIQNSAKIDFPALIIGGWYDPFIRGTFEDYQRMVATPHSKSQRSQLLVGPWAHNPAKKHPGIDFGKEAGFEVILNHCLDWCDEWLKQKGITAHSHQKIRFFLMGKNRWKETDEWPPESSEEEILFLSGENNRLSNTIPLQAYRQHYLYNPRDPALFRGSHLLYTDGWVMPIEQEQMERSDLLVYTSDPVEKELSVAGIVKLQLFVSSNVLDTDFCVTLSDLHPNGKAYNLTPGFFRMLFRESLSEPKHMEPGKVYRIEIPFRPMAHCFIKGHRIQPHISSADFPIHNRNLNTGMSCEYTSELKEALQTVLTGGEYASKLILPIYRGG